MRCSEKIRIKFNNLSMADKERLVYKFGKWLGNRNESHFHISLYHIRHKIIEVWYNRNKHEVQLIDMPSYKELDSIAENIYLDL
jgi:hypothetical protein